MPDEYIRDLDVTPDKEVLISISKDIDLYRGICEMIDNSIDNWILNGKENGLFIDIFMDQTKNAIFYEDNSGGIKEDVLPLIIQPDGTERTSEEETIGIFGVGAKRALIALSKHSETISRYPSEDTFKIILDVEWLENDKWEIPQFKTDPIEEGHTKFILKNLNFTINRDIIQNLMDLVSETYYFYLTEHEMKIKFNGSELESKIFDAWSYPLNGWHPREYQFIIHEKSDVVRCSIIVGLMLESSQKGNFGFDLFCNDRRILKEVIDYRLGFKKGTDALGSPHSTIAWFRGIIRINGKNKHMPWNSSKSDLNMLHPVYKKLYEWIIKLCKPYVQLNRRIYSESDKLIRPYTTGRIEKINLIERKLRDKNKPPLPPGRISYFEKAKKENKDLIKEKPWTRGLLENILAVDAILKTSFENKNRYALILLDSCLEIGFKEFIVNVKKIPLPPEKKKFREILHKQVKKNTTISVTIWDKIEHYYRLRCDLYHEKATPTLTNEDILDYRELVCGILEKLHRLTFEFSEGAPFLNLNKERSGEE